SIQIPPPRHEITDLEILGLADLPAGQESLILQLYRTMRVRVGRTIGLVKRSLEVPQAGPPRATVQHDQHSFQSLPPGSRTQFVGKMPGIGRAQGRLPDQTGRQSAECRIVEPDHEVLIAGRLALVV